MRKSVSAVLAGALCVSLLAGCSESGSAQNSEPVSVESVASIVSAGSVGLLDWYAGMVVSGETADIKRDSDKTVLDIYVKVGDTVRAGEPLFCYDSEKMQLDLDKLYLKRDDYANTISSANNEITELEDQRSKAKDEDKLSYTLQIDSRRADIREAEYNSSLNERDIASLETALQNTEITSPIAGRVMTVDEEGGSDGGYYDDGSEGGGSGIDFITVTDVTSLRIQGNISEMNAGALTEGMPMTIRSRIDQDQTWQGTVSSIDWDNPVQNNNSDSGVVYMSSSGDDGMTTASRYPFYIDLESTEGLLLGQHVYIEPDTGDGEEQPEGPMLPGYYIAYDGEDPYVWAEDGKGKLEKRAVTLGIYDEMSDRYEIADGLDLGDYIAFPEERLTEGQPAEKYEPAAEEDAGEGGMEAAAVGG